MTLKFRVFQGNNENKAWITQGNLKIILTGLQDYQDILNQEHPARKYTPCLRGFVREYE
jgi:hypothetical protein